MTAGVIHEDPVDGGAALAHGDLCGKADTVQKRNVQTNTFEVQLRVLGVCARCLHVNTSRIAN